MLESIPLLFLTGLVLGLQHAFEPDHLVAVSVFAVESKDLRRSIWLGFSWGLGHTTTLMLIGGLILALNVSIPENIAGMFELFVGAMLILIGLQVIVRLYHSRIHLHEHTHDESGPHSHFHTHDGEHGHTHDHTHAGTWRGFLFGLIHGVAGSSAAVLIVLSLVSNVWQGLLLILLFGVGSIGGMLIATIVIWGLTLQMQPTWMKRMQGIVAVSSILVGGLIFITH
jgi:ABC-type nickel/cobalt efflux system permease component RcnA